MIGREINISFENANVAAVTTAREIAVLNEVIDHRAHLTKP